LVEQAGANVNAQNSLGRTPLHLAAVSNMQRQAETLLALGAEAKAVDVDGRTAGDVAHMLGHTALASLLDEKAGGPARNRGSAPSEADCSIAVLSPAEVANLTAERFYRDYVSLLRPVLLRGATPPSEASGQLLTWAELASRFGDVRTSVASVPYASLYGAADTVQHMRLGDFLKEHLRLQADGTLGAAATGDGGPAPGKAAPYIFDGQLMARVPALGSTIPPPTALIGTRFILQQFMAGGVGSGAAPHFHGHALNLLAQGEKRWQLVPPSGAFFRFVTAAEHFASLAQQGREEGVFCTQAAGDGLFVPSSWAHAVLNTRPALAVAYEFAPTFVMERSV